MCCILDQSFGIGLLARLRFGDFQMLGRSVDELLVRRVLLEQARVGQSRSFRYLLHLIRCSAIRASAFRGNRNEVAEIATRVDALGEQSLVGAIVTRVERRVACARFRVFGSLFRVRFGGVYANQLAGLRISVRSLTRDGMQDRIERRHVGENPTNASSFQTRDRRCDKTIVINVCHAADADSAISFNFSFNLRKSENRRGNRKTSVSSSPALQKGKQRTNKPFELTLRLDPLAIRRTKSLLLQHLPHDLIDMLARLQTALVTLDQLVDMIDQIVDQMDQIRSFERSCSRKDFWRRRRAEGAARIERVVDVVDWTERVRGGAAAAFERTFLVHQCSSKSFPWASPSASFDNEE